jgi:NAD(P)-dependent dehydrogenase (short-subunit alcohol dehydrogenase family)
MTSAETRSLRHRPRLDDRHVVVTGAGNGIGLALARAAAVEGARVACVDIDLDAATSTAAELVVGGTSAHALHCDITDPASVSAALAACIDLGGPVDVLLANAGGAQGMGAPFLEITPEAWVTMLDRNLNGPFHTGQAFARHMAEHGRGSIVFTSSQVSMVAFENLAHYCAAKAGVSHLVRCMAAELAQYGVRVNAIAPGGVMTDRLRARMASSDSLGNLHTRIPMNRLAEPEEVTGAAMYLASDDAAYTTGAIVVVDGGYTAI